MKKLSDSEVKELDQVWHGVPEPLQKVLDAVKEWKQTGDHEYMARCVMPDHPDTNPSLHITWDPVERRVLLHCFGCQASFEDLVGAMGLQPGELSMPGAGAKKIVATYDYCDEEGQLRYQTVRYEPKDFRQRRPDGKGGWVWDLNGVQRMLYRLPELLKADTPLVWIAEGEKDVETLRGFGHVATTSGGAGSWRSEFAEFFRGRHVVIIPDKDGPGKRYGDQVAHDLFGVAESVRVFDLPCGKDFSEFVQLGGEGEHLEAYCSLYARSVKEAPAYTDGPTVTWCDTVELREVEWLWPGRIPLGKLTLLVGEAGKGKSLLTLDMAARISTGTAWPDGRGTPGRGSVLICTTEDDLEDTVAVRLAAAGADLSRIAHVKNVFDVKAVVDAATAEIRRGRDDIKLIIMDPVTEYLGKADSYKNAEVRSAFAPLIAFGQDRHIAFLGVTHYSKMEKTSAANKISGSTGFNAVARQVWHLIQDGSERLFVAGKANLTSEHSGLAYTVQATTVKHKDKELSAVKIEFKPDPVYEDADDVMIRLWRKPGKAETAESWLRLQLAEGPKEVHEIERLAKEADIKWHTVLRAKEALNVVSDQIGKGKGRKSLWRLPKT
jgi:putative DNA primase/helicase